MMVLSPQTINARIQKATTDGRMFLADALSDIQQDTLSNNNPLAQEKFRPELFFDSTLSPKDLKYAMESWKDISSNSAGRDDMTAVCIHMDKVFEK
jgi:hypothetical protein